MKGEIMGRTLKAAHQGRVHARLCSLPRKMVHLHGHDNLTEFVLYELCNEQCFNFKRAAYFVDSPDFNCLKGIAGFCRDDIANINTSKWSDPNEFATHIQQAIFNQKVRNYIHESLRKKGETDEQIVELLTQELGLSSPMFCAWDMKHGNHGMFVFEPSQPDIIPVQDDLLNGLSLLSFCPIY